MAVEKCLSRKEDYDEKDCLEIEDELLDIEGIIDKKQILEVHLLRLAAICNKYFKYQHRSN